MAFLNPEDLKKTERRSGRLLGLDIGDSTIGLALSDSMWMIASPGKTLKRSKIPNIAREIHLYVAQEPIQAMVVGLPKNLDGTLGARAKGVKDFTYALSQHLPFPYVFWDERFSTLGAQRVLQEADLSYKKKNQVIDAIAAAYILQGFLDYCAQD